MFLPYNFSRPLFPWLWAEVEKRANPTKLHSQFLSERNGFVTMELSSGGDKAALTLVKILSGNLIIYLLVSQRLHIYSTHIHKDVYSSLLWDITYIWLYTSMPPKIYFLKKKKKVNKGLCLFSSNSWSVPYNVSPLFPRQQRQ